MTKKSITILLFFLSVIFLLGLLGMIISGRYEIIEESRLVRLSLKYFLLPSLFLSAIVSYLLSFEYRKHLEKWRKILAFISALFAMTLVYLFCFHGILRYINNKIGHQESITLNSKIISLEKDKDKSIADITIIHKKDTLKLTISEHLYDKYLNKSNFNEIVIEGSLGYFYKE